MQTLNTDLKKSAKKIFKLFFNSKIQVKNNNKNTPWGVDLDIEYNGKKKLSLFLEENTLKSVIKHITGSNDLHNQFVVYDIIGEIARMIAGSAIGERSDNYSLCQPVKAQIINPVDSYRRVPSTESPEYSLCIEKI
jgi:hypothetical protein